MAEQKRMIGVYVDEELFEKLSLSAKKRGINSVATFIRFTMVEHLNEREAQKAEL